MHCLKELLIYGNEVNLNTMFYSTISDIVTTVTEVKMTSKVNTLVLT